MPDLRERVNAFPRWHYEIDLGGGVLTPIFDPSIVNRHAQRARYFFEPLVALCGGSLAGKRVLDLACNAGFWSLKALEAGADFVFGIDGREMHVEQANLVMEAKGIDPSRYRFECANVFEWTPSETFDIVTCLGLLYHVARPFELLERCSEWGSDLLLLDTNVSLLPGSAIEIKHERMSNPGSSVEYPLVMFPTRAAVVDILTLVGYRAATLQPRFTSWEGSKDFRDGTRFAFIAAKQTPLVGLDEAVVLSRRNWMAAARARIASS